MCRQFRTPREILDEFGIHLDFQWNIRRSQPQEHAHKLLLVKESAGTRCEAVALFPHAVRHTASPLTADMASKLPRATACISSQPGCGVGCPFCSTGELGFRGHLTAHEITEQVYWLGVQAAQVGRRLRNVVYMGMGEPLHNTDNVLESLRWLTCQRLFGIPARRITVSTAGVPRAMLQLAREFPKLRLALSLHAVEPELRRYLVPRAVSDMRILRSTIRELNAVQVSHPVWLEIVLFEQLNDTLEHARQLTEFCAGLRVEVNLIPYNSASGGQKFKASARQPREAFANILRQAGIRTTIRTSFGQSNAAACGQLSAKLD